MPQLNKGGKFVFGFSVIQPDLTIYIPPQTLSEYGLAGDEKVIIFSGSKTTGGFCVTTYPLLLNSKLKHILEECPQLRECQLSEGEFIQYKGRKYAWVSIDKNGVIKMPRSTLSVLELQAGMELLSIRSSDIAFTMGAKGPLLEKARNFHGDIAKYPENDHINNEKIYRKLVQLTKNKTIWKQNIPFVASLLENQSPKITAKAMWLLGEMGLMYPQETAPYIKEIASFIVSENDLLRERSANALGRIGRADYESVAPYWKELFILAGDKSPDVRLSFIWASENIATNSPMVYKDYLPVFAELLDDENERVRIEAPEMFRVLGKRTPEFVRPYLEKLEYMAAHDEVSVVRIHARGAIKAALSETVKKPDARARNCL